MLQIGNIAKKPVIWLAPTLTSAILGPVSTMVLHMTNNAVGAGMGTAGLVGPLAAYAVMGPEAATDGQTWTLVCKIVGLYFIAPAAICLSLDSVTRRLGWVSEGDMKLIK
jgi:uncharacterized membrane protein